MLLLNFWNKIFYKFHDSNYLYNVSNRCHSFLFYIMMRRRLSQGIRALCFTLLSTALRRTRTPPAPGLSSPMRRQPPPAHGCGSTHCRTPPRPRWALVAPRSKGPVVRTRGGRDRAVKKIPRPRRSRHSPVMSLQQLAGILCHLKSRKREGQAGQLVGSSANG